MDPGAALSILDIPEEIIREIMVRTDDRSIIRYCQSNTKSLDLCKDQSFWIQKVKFKFPDLIQDEINWWFTDPELSDDNPFINYLRLVSSFINQRKYITYGSETFIDIDICGDVAAMKYDREMVEYFLNKGASLTGVTTGASFNEKDPDMVKWLILEKGANPNDAMEGTQLTGRLDLLLWLIDKGGKGISPTFLGLSNNVDMIRWAITNRRITRRDTKYLIKSVGESSNVDVLKYLITERGETPYKFLRYVRTLKAAEYLINMGGDSTILENPSLHSSPDMIRWIIEVLKIPVNSHIMMTAGFSGDLELVKWLMEENGGKDIDIKIWTVWVIDPDIIRYLISMGMEPLEVISGLSMNVDLELVKELMEIGGITPDQVMNIIPTNLRTLQYLINSGAKLSRDLARHISDTSNLEVVSYINREYTKQQERIYQL